MVNAKYFYGIECDESDKSLFMTSNGGSTISCVVMVFRYVIKATAQQDLEWLIDKLILYILHACRLSIKYKYPPTSIIAMDEKSI